MFGIGFTELILISIVAIIFLGPDKLPQAMIDIAKFIKSVKKTISDAKGSLEEEMKIADLKEEALSYKRQLDDATNELQNFKNLSLDDFDDDVTYDEEISTKESRDLVSKSNSFDANKPASAEDETSVPQVEKKQDESITLKKKPKKEKTKSEAMAQNTQESTAAKTDDSAKDNA